MDFEFVENMPAESHNSVLGKDFGDVIYGADAQQLWLKMMAAGPVIASPLDPKHVVTTTA